MSGFRYPQTVEEAMHDMDMYRAERDWYAARSAPLTQSEANERFKWVIEEAAKHRRRRESEPLATI